MIHTCCYSQLSGEDEDLCIHRSYGVQGHSVGKVMLYPSTDHQNEDYNLSVKYTLSHAETLDITVISGI